MASETQNVNLALATSKSVLEVARFLKERRASGELRRFYGHLMVHCVLVSDHVNRIKSIRGLQSGSIISVLDVFESLIAPAATTRRGTSLGRMYPRQHALNRAWRDLRQGSEDARLYFAAGCLDVVRPQYHDDLFRKWEEDVVVWYPDDVAQWSAEDHWPLKKRRTEPSYAVCTADQTLFKALAASAECPCRPPHELSAWLHRDHSNCFDMFLATGQVLQEAHAYIVQGGVAWLFPSDSAQRRTEKRRYVPMVVKVLCEQIAKMPTTTPQRLELKVKRGHLLKLRSGTSSFSIDKKRPPVSLQHVIQGGCRQLTEKIKRILAVLLSYAVLHLHGTPWLKPSWDSSDILFFHTPSSKIPLRPFILTQLSDRQAAAASTDPGSQRTGAEFVCFDDGLDPDDLYSEALDPDDVEHPLPALVALAAKLMELFFANSMENLARNCGIHLPLDPESRTCSLDVEYIFQTYRREVPRNTQFYHAIQKCLDTRIWQGEREQTLDDQALRATIYEEVVRPLEDELCDAFDFITIEDLDQIAETVDFRKWGQTIPRTEDQTVELSPCAVDETVHKQHRCLMNPLPNPPYSPIVTSTRESMPNPPLRGWQHLTSPSKYTAAEFYDNENTPGIHREEQYVCGNTDSFLSVFSP